MSFEKNSLFIADCLFLLVLFAKNNLTFLSLERKIQYLQDTMP